MDSEFYTVKVLSTTGAIVEGLNLAATVSPEVNWFYTSVTWTSDLLTVFTV